MTVGIKRLCWWDTIAGEPQWIISWVKRNGQGQTGLGGTNKWDAILVYGCAPDGQTDLIEVNNDYSERIASRELHPTAKPGELWGAVIERFSSRYELLYEPFSGTGTALIAAEQLGQACYAMEIEPAYCDVAVRRWERVSGRQAHKAHA
jgi:DNA modification methylase